jgi:hypothetical protein
MKLRCYNKDHVDKLNVLALELNDDMCIHELQKLFSSHGYVLGPYISLRGIGEDMSGNTVLFEAHGRTQKVGKLDRIDPEGEARISGAGFSTLSKLRSSL